jgi:hypothetical protein
MDSTSPMKSSQECDMSSMQDSRNSAGCVPFFVLVAGMTFHSTSRTSLSMANSSAPTMESFWDISRKT